MRSKSIVLIVLALGCGLVAAIGATQVLERNKTAGEQGETQAVFVALTDIAPNEELTPQNIKTQEWPKDHIPPGALTKIEEVEGKRSRMKLYAGEPILGSKLLGAADAVGAAKDIPPGYRVEHVNVDSVTGSSNLILPGDRVDVLLFRQPSGNSPRAQVAKIVLQDIKVFAVDTHTETEFSRNKTEGGDPITAKSIALLVTPQQALILHAASQVGGAVRLVLRNPEDDSHVAVSGATLEDVFGPDEPSSRDREQGGGKDPKEDVSQWLDKQNGKVPPAESTALTQTTPAGSPRRMVVIMGAELKQVELPGHGELPRNQPTVGSQGGGSDPASGGSGGAMMPLAPPLPHEPDGQGSGDTEQDSAS
jgi:pilus assembly protein CpaB